MRELSLHVLDIVANSIEAEADLIEIKINEDIKRDVLEITVIDNGKGMTPEQLQQVTDPFYTSRSTRKVGLGIPLFKANAEICNGQFLITSQVGQGTTVYASFQHSHIDRVPLGDMVTTLITMIIGKPEIRFIYKYKYNGQEFNFDTEVIKEQLGDELSITNPIVLDWLKEYLRENIDNIRKNDPYQQLQ